MTCAILANHMTPAAPKVYLTHRNFPVAFTSVAVLGQLQSEHSTW